MNTSQTNKQLIKTLENDFKKTLNGKALQNTDYKTLKQIRSNYFSYFLNTGFPTINTTNSKFINTNSFFKTSSSTITNDTSLAAERSIFLKDFCNFPNVYKIHFHNGILTKDSDLPKGLKLCSWKTLSPEFPAWDFITKQDIKDNKNGFYYLAGAFALEGYLLYVSPSFNDFKSLHIHVSFDKSHPSLLRNFKNFIFLDKNSKLKLTESISAPQNKIFNTVTQVKQKEHSELEWLHLDQVLSNCMSLNQTFLDLEAHSKVNRLSMHLGSGSSQEILKVDHLHKKSHSTLLSLSFLKKRGIKEQKFFINHKNTEGFSKQLSRGIINDTAKNIFYGKIHIKSKAANTECSQSIKNILLSNTAQSYSQPELEIYCGDVKAKHGATSGQFNEQDIFYLQSRGLDLKHCVDILMMGYIYSVVNQFTQTSLKKHIMDHIQNYKNIYLNL